MKKLLRALILVCLVSGLCASTPARAQEDETGAQLPITRRTRYITLVGLDFHSYRSDLRYFVKDGGIYPLPSEAPYPLRFNAPLYFPNGAILTAVEYFFIDSDPTANMTFEIISAGLTDYSGLSIDKRDTSGFYASEHVQSVIWTGAQVIDNTLAYRLQVDFGAATDKLILQGVQITYTVPILGGGETCITIAGGDFVPNQSGLVYRAEGQAKYIVQQTYPVESWLIAPLDLADGAQVNRVDFHVRDNHNLNDVTVYFVRKDPDFDSQDLTKGWSLLRSSKTNLYYNIPQKISFSGSPLLTVDTRHYSYLLGVALRAPSTDHLLISAQVCYEPPAAAQGMQTRTYMGSAFRPFSTSLEFSLYNSDLGSLYVTGDTTNGIFGANLNLPDGVMIRRVVYFITDNSQNYNFLLAGRRFVPSLGTAGDLFPQKTWLLDASTDVRSITVDVPGGKEAVYDSDMDNFRLAALMPGSAQDDLLLHGARVDYFYPKYIYLPAVRK